MGRRLTSSLFIWPPTSACPVKFFEEKELARPALLNLKAIYLGLNFYPACPVKPVFSFV
jgi:hypothetical protein